MFRNEGGGTSTESRTPAWQRCCCGCCWPLSRLVGYQNSYTSAFSDQGPEASVASSHYQAPSPSSRPGSQTAPVQQAVEAADPENSALLGKGQTSSTELQETGSQDTAPRTDFQDARLHRRIQSADHIARLAESKVGDSSPRIPKLGSGLKLAPDDEDVCPTCLDPYSEENPKILTQCNHHFHLACIYEWLERSQTCPICSREMSFDEFL
ncbi:hypothetical protein ABBQ38_005096 [Trebouxia sp. C0009 RCD-2024]